MGNDIERYEFAEEGFEEAIQMGTWTINGLVFLIDFEDTRYVLVASDYHCEWNLVAMGRDDDLEMKENITFSYGSPIDGLLGEEVVNRA